MAEVVSCWFLAADTWVLSQAILCGICGGCGHWDRFSSECFGFPQPLLIYQ